MPRTLQREQKKYCHHRRLRYRSRRSIMAETKQQRLKANSFRQPIPYRRRKKYSVGELELLVVVWGLERFRFHLYGK